MYLSNNPVGRATGRTAVEVDEVLPGLGRRRHQLSINYQLIDQIASVNCPNGEAYNNNNNNNIGAYLVRRKHGGLLALPALPERPDDPRPPAEAGGPGHRASERSIASVNCQSINAMQCMRPYNNNNIGGRT